MNYYNEIDPKAAAWLRELIKAGEIPPGDVDERSIVDVQPADLNEYTQCHFFAGIAGWPYALELAGWPADRPVWTGSCPCQPFSATGKRLGAADDRHLWPAWFRLIRECRPERVFGEQVASAIGHGWLDGISTDLEAEGYACGAVVLGAHSLGAPHIRQRLYWMADAQGGDREVPERAGREGVLKSGRGSGTGGLAAPDGRKPGTEREQRGREHGQQPQDGGTGGMDDMQQQRLERHPRAGAGGVRYVGEISQQDRPIGAAGDALGPWRSSRLHACRDGKLRRIPVESRLFGLVDGLPEGVDFGWLESGFPLAGKIEGRAGLLRGYGNAIVPQVAAEFIQATQ